MSTTAARRTSKRPSPGSVSDIKAARVAISNIEQGALRDVDVIELVSGILGRFGSTDVPNMEKLMKTAIADHCNIVIGKATRK